MGIAHLMRSANQRELTTTEKQSQQAEHKTEEKKKGKKGERNSLIVLALLGAEEVDDLVVRVHEQRGLRTPQYNSPLSTPAVRRVSTTARSAVPRT
eukprot:234860-Rhodomonas_salina.1